MEFYPGEIALLLLDKVEEVLDKVRDRIEEKFDSGHPYAIISLKWIKNDLELKRRSGVDFLERKLEENYRVGKDGNWLIIEEE